MSNASPWAEVAEDILPYLYRIFPSMLIEGPSGAKRPVLNQRASYCQLRPAPMLPSLKRPHNGQYTDRKRGTPISPLNFALEEPRHL